MSIKEKNKQGWVIVDGVHCCYCQLADYACPKHEEKREQSLLELQFLEKMKGANYPEGWVEQNG